jgi:hypothetical protein
MRRLNVQCLLRCVKNADTYMIFADFRSAYVCVTEVCKNHHTYYIVTRQGVKKGDGLPPLFLV